MDLERQSYIVAPKEFNFTMCLINDRPAIKPRSRPVLPVVVKYDMILLLGCKKPSP